MIRKLDFYDFENASSVLWKSFYHAEKNIHSIKGLETFRDLTSAVSLSISEFQNKIEYFGYFLEEVLVGVGAVKDKKHILMLYVLPDFQGMGIGKELLLFLERVCEEKEVTLRASDGAISFYQKYGFEISGQREISEELIGTPMKKIQKNS